VKGLTLKASNEQIKREVLLREISILKEKLERNRYLFNQATDSDLIESFLYEEKALLSRYDFLIKRAREEGITIPYPFL
jgi:hypothetical protein